MINISSEPRKRNPSIETISVMPNPSSDVVTIKMEDMQSDQNYEYKIIDLSGRIMVSNELKEVTHVSVQTWTKGMYIIQIFKDNEPLHIQKLSVIH